MLEEQVSQAIAECERYAARDGYPAEYPPLPTIPAARYTDQRLYDLEMEHVWKKTWLMVGHTSEIKETGDYKLFQYIGQNVIISHGPDGEIRAFHNICRHRSAPLVTEEKGRAKRFLCPYHSWSFSAKGELQTVPEQHNFPCLDKSKMSLLPVRCETWRGFIFLNFDDDAISLEEFIAPVAKRLVDFPFEQMEVKRFVRLELGGNWKAVFDNFIESYHLNTVHPTIARWIQSSSFVVKPLRHGHAHFTLMRNNRNRYAIERPMAPPGSYPLFEEVIINTPVFPNLAGGLDLNGFVWDTFWPNGPDKTIMDIPLLGWKDGHDDAFWDNAMAENMRFAGEDIELLPQVHKAMQTGHVKEIHVGYQEMGIYWYHEEIDRLIGSENVPEDLRMQQVLEAYAED